MLPSFYWDLYPAVKRRQHNDKNKDSPNHRYQ